MMSSGVQIGSGTLPPSVERVQGDPAGCCILPNSSDDTRSSSSSSSSSSRSCSELLTVPAAPCDALAALRKSTLTCQGRGRRNPLQNAAGGAGVGLASGMMGGTVIAIAAAVPTGGASLLAWPICMVGGAAVGASVGALGKFRQPAPFDEVRSRIFVKTGVVARRRDSQGIIRELKKAGVLQQGRRRLIVRPDRIDVALAQLPLNSEQQQKVHTVLKVIEDESAHWNGVVADLAIVQQEAKDLKHKKYKTPEDEQVLAQLRAQAARAKSQLDEFPPLV